MIRLAALAFAAIISTFQAFAGCEGADLVAAMPAEGRARMEAEEASVPFARGLFWQATAPDGTDLVIVGTYHPWDARQKAQMARLAPVLAQADLLVTEVTDEDEKAMMKRIAGDPSLAFITEGPSLLTELGPDWPPMKAKMDERGIPSVLAAKFRPWYAVMTLGLAPCMAASLKAGERGLDVQLLRAAEAAGMPTLALDDVEAVLATLTAGTDAEQLELLRLSLRSPVADEDFTTTLLDLYFEGRSWVILNLTRFIDLGLDPADSARLDALTTGFMARMVEDRNRSWADKLVPMTAGKKALVAVGAGHLPGENGLLSLLQARGFAVAPLEGQVSPISD